MGGMKQTAFVFVLFFGFLSFCAGQTHDAGIAKDQIPLEQEILKIYGELEAEADKWMTASTRAYKGDTDVKISADKKELYEAIQKQKYNRYDVDQYKRLGTIGENNRGLLEIRSLDAMSGDPAGLKRVKTIVDQENKDRKLIMKRIMKMKNSLKEAGAEAVYPIFAQIKQKDSPEGTWIQKEEGEWVRK